MIFSTDIQLAIKLLKQGKLIAIPTETVYGLAANARDEKALKKIFSVKKRPAHHPIIVHIAQFNQIKEWAREVPEEAYLLASSFWPGPLTLILKKQFNVSDFITGQQDTVGIRIPSHSLTLKLLNHFKNGVAAPSANRFGQISPTTPEAVYKELGESVDLILQGGQCSEGLESTILDLSGHQPIILRPGIITAEQIETILNTKIYFSKKDSPRVSGALASHYAPRTKVILFPNGFSLSKKILNNKKISIILAGDHSQKYAHDLYQTVRELDEKNLEAIWIETPPNTSEWAAARDRLIKMAHPKKD